MSLVHVGLTASGFASSPSAMSDSWQALRAALDRDVDERRELA